MGLDSSPACGISIPRRYDEERKSEGEDVNAKAQRSQDAKSVSENYRYWSSRRREEADSYCSRRRKEALINLFM